MDDATQAVAFALGWESGTLDCCLTEIRRLRETNASLLQCRKDYAKLKGYNLALVQWWGLTRYQTDLDTLVKNLDFHVAVLREELLEEGQDTHDLHHVQGYI